MTVKQPPEGGHLSPSQPPAPPGRQPTIRTSSPTTTVRGPVLTSAKGPLPRALTLQFQHPERQDLSSPQPGPAPGRHPPDLRPSIHSERTSPHFNKGPLTKGPHPSVQNHLIQPLLATQPSVPPEAHQLPCLANLKWLISSTSSNLK